MHTWKDYLEQDREYKSETIQGVSEKAIANASIEDQLKYLNDALESENAKLQALLKDREIEEASKKGASSSEAKPTDKAGEKAGAAEKSEKKKKSKDKS